MFEDMRRGLRDVDSSMPELSAWVYRRIEQHLGHRVIDAGAGIGTYSELLQEHGKQVVALEADPELVPDLRSRLEPSGGEVYACDLAAPEGLPNFEPADSAICINVAEHLDDDRQGLLNVRERVLPGGKLFIFVPAHPWLYNRIDKAAGHFRRYQRRELADRLVESGWQLEGLTYFNCFSIPLWFIAGTVLRRDMPGTSLMRLAGTIMPLLDWLDRTLSRGKAGVSLIAVARNPGPDVSSLGPPEGAQSIA